ncbi:endonuclease III-like protein 1 [Panonychus citri]|uniref:endonuclease III-like protein 1 n=1 Tax=Panonychus citri TaxID=50023 RepID=UPI002306F801|nr:endonuclease III-like protein 1 [Panonychus citri]
MGKVTRRKAPGAVIKKEAKDIVDEPVVKRSKRNHIAVKDEGDEVDEVTTKTQSKESWRPKNWPEAYENVKKMMEGVVAPVESLPWFQSKDPKKTKPLERFRILVALILSSRTKDEPLLKAWNALCEEGLSIDWILEKDQDEIANLIKSCSFYKQKANHIKQTAAILKEEHGGDTPDTLKELSDLPGVGSKTAVLFLQCCYGKVEGIGPDGYIVRVVNRLSWVPKPVNCHTRTRTQLESWLPKETMLEFNRLISRFGQTKCNEDPKCGECLNNKICQGARKTKK